MVLGVSSMSEFNGKLTVLVLKVSSFEANSTDLSLSCRIWAVLSYIPVDYQWFPTVIYDYQEVTFNSGMFMYYTELVQA